MPDLISRLTLAAAEETISASSWHVNCLSCWRLTSSSSLAFASSFSILSTFASTSSQHRILHYNVHAVECEYGNNDNKCTPTVQTSSNKAKMWTNAPSCNVEMHNIYLFNLGWTVMSSATNSSRLLPATAARRCDHLQSYAVSRAAKSKFSVFGHLWSGFPKFNSLPSPKIHLT